MKNHIYLYAAICSISCISLLNAYKITVTSHSSQTIWVAPYQQKKGAVDTFERLAAPQLLYPKTTIFVKNVKKNTSRTTFYLLGSPVQEGLPESITPASPDLYVQLLDIGTGATNFIVSAIPRMPLIRSGLPF